MKSEKKEKQKRVISRKQKIIVLVVVLVVLLSLIIGYFIYQNKLIREIKEKYSTYVITNKNINLYQYADKKYVKVGKVSSNLTLGLDKQKDRSSQYFKIKNSNYYLYYQDIKKDAKKILDYDMGNFLVFNQQVKVKKNTKLYQKSKESIQLLDEFHFALLYKDEMYYYVEYLDQVFAIKQSDAKLEEKENTKEEETSKISVLYYEAKPTDQMIAEEMGMLSEKRMYTLSLDEYKKWLQGYVRLKKNAILLVSKDENFKSDQYIINYLTDEQIKFINNNQVSEKGNKLEEISSYYITSETTKEYFEKILKQESFEYPKKVIPEVNNRNTKRILEGNAVSIPVINYHFFYDPALGEACNEGICLSVQKFEEQLKYLKDHGYKTLKMEEFRKWMYGEIELPAKSVLLTVDDGAMGTGKHNGNKLIPLLEKYQSYATLFLITGWWGYDNYISPNLDVESHTHDMHTEGICNTEARGAKLLCSTYEEAVNDLKNSMSVTKSNEAFCYPFFVTNEKATKAVQDVGFKLAFVGGNSYATRNSHKFRIPRFPIYSSTSLQQFINIIG